MLKTLLAFAGFTSAPAPRPPSRRRVAPAAAPAVAPVVPDAEARARRNRETAERLRPDPNARFATDVALVVRTYDPHSTQPSPEELHLALCRLGEVGAYVRAVYLGGGRLAVLPASQRDDRVRTRAYRDHLTHLAATDFERWSQGLAALDRAVASARRTGDPLPATIPVTDAVEAGIAKLAAEKARRLSEQAARRTGGGGTTGGSAGPTGSAPAAPPALPPAGPRWSEESNEETPEGSEPPAGPKR
ncbi:hypothetical protein ACIQW5_26580 [Methylorubrum thiocyanatum]|uniref:hypothetical protein n=1 Tax=Methylorubrum thiocyanatum TaxID=47958 RepID=UPI00383B8FCB